MAIVAGVMLGALGIYGIASGISAASCSGTNPFRPGDTISSSGSGGTPGETVTLHFNGPSGPAIGAATVDGGGFFTVSGTIPSSATPNTYQIFLAAASSTSIAPCFATVTTVAVATTPPSSTATPQPSFAHEPDTGSQQQQQGGPGQQQQAGLGQQQQQQVIIPAAAVNASGILPKTGSDAKVLSRYALAFLAAGLLLAVFAWQLPRRFSWASIKTSWSEADLLLPYLRRRK